MGLIRFLLALCVVAAHCGSFFGLKLVGPQVAVQSFFIISGFYMSMILNEKYVKKSSYRLFITNRFLRLFPIYWVVLLATVLICIAIKFITAGQSFPIFSSYLSVKANFWSFLYLILTNVFLFGQDVVMFLGIRPQNGSLFFTKDFSQTAPPLHSFLFIRQAWSLGIELMFYLIAPFILRRKMPIIVALILLSFLLRLYLYNRLGLQNDPWSYRFFPTEIMFFLFGYISYKIYLKIKTITISRPVNLFVYCFIFLFTASYSFIPQIKINYLPFSLNEIIYFFSIVLSIPILFNFLKANKFDNSIGELSYPMYVSHLSVGLVCYLFPYHILKTGVSIIFITIVVSYLLNKMIAYPMEKYRQSRFRKNALTV